MELLTQKPQEGISIFKIDNTIVIISENKPVNPVHEMLGLVSLSMRCACFDGENSVAEVIDAINSCEIIVCDPTNPDLDRIKSLFKK